MPAARRLIVATVVVLTLLALWPATSWILRRQAAMQFAPDAGTVAMLRDLGVRDFPLSLLVNVQDGRADYERAALSAPDDYLLSLGLALTTPETTENARGAAKLAALRGLANRFPASAPARAHLLRTYTLGRVRVNRPEELEITAQMSGGSVSGYRPTSCETWDYADFVGQAHVGESLDPENAFFPLMRSVALFGQHRDAEALDALNRAAACARYDDYAIQEYEAMRRLSRAAYGEQSALADATRAASVLLPHYAQIRGVGRMAVWHAQEAEAHGDVARGLAIRTALLQSMARMRADSSMSIGMLVAVSVCDMALMRRGDAPANEPDDWRKPEASDYEAVMRARLDRHVQLLRDQSYCQFQVVSGGIVRDKERAKTGKAVDPEERCCPTAFRDLDQGHWAYQSVTDYSWPGTSILCDEGRTIIACPGNSPMRVRVGGDYLAPLDAMLYGEAERVRAEFEAGRQARDIVKENARRFGFGGSSLWRLMLWWVAGQVVLANALAMLLAGGAACALRAYRPRLRGLLAVAAVILPLCVVGGVAWQVTAPVFGQYAALLASFSNMSEGGSAGWNVEVCCALLVAAPFLSLIVPLLTIFTTAVFARQERVPFGVGLLRAFRGLAGRTVCALLLLWAALLVGTAWAEANAGIELARVVEHEGRAYAAHLGQSWPVSVK